MTTDVIVVPGDTTTVIDAGATTTVTTVDDLVQLITEGVQGPAGAQGPIGTGGALGHYGVFYSTATQTNAGATSVNAITLNNTAEANGVSIVSNSRVTFAAAGTYNIQFSVQAAKSDSGHDVFEIWLAKNGTDVAQSNTALTIYDNNGKAVAAWNFMITLAAGDYIELRWASADTQLYFEAAGVGTSPTRPAVPSVILTAHQVMYTQGNAEEYFQVINLFSELDNETKKTGARQNLGLQYIDGGTFN